MPTGIGGEQLWLSPTVANNVNPYDDQSGQGNNGTAGASITIVSDTSNGGTLAYNFPNTGSTNAITINDFDLGGLSELTWSAWIYDDTENAAIRHGSFFSWRSSGGTGSDDILFHDYERRLLAFQLNNNQDGGSIYTPVYFQNWKHYCVVFDGTNSTASDRLNLYVNGALQVPDTTFAFPATTTTIAGTKYAEIGDYVGNTNWSTFNFKGKQDDIRVFDRAITQAEISHLATSRGIQGAPSSNPIALVNSTSVNSAGPTTAMDTTGADLIVISCSGYGNVPTVSDSESNTWIPLNFSGASRRQQMHYCLSPSTSSTHTFSNNGAGSPAMSVLAFSGVLDFESQVLTGDILAATIQTGAMTPSTDGCLVIAGAVNEGGTYTAVDSGFTLETSETYVAGQNMGNATAYLVQSTASSVNPQLTNSGNTWLSASGAVFTPSNATPPTTHYNPFKSHAFTNNFQQRLR